MEMVVNIFSEERAFSGLGYMMIAQNIARLGIVDMDAVEQVIQVSGIVRPIDLDFDNKVKSTRMAQFHIVTQMKGPENNLTNPGWFSQFANFFNPF